MIDIPVETRTRAGVGHSLKENSFDAGVEIATNALSQAMLSEETMFLLFSSPHHKVEALIEGVRSVIGSRPEILGCTTTGVITADYLSYTGIMAGGAFISAGTPFFKLFTEDIKDQEFDAGRRLAEQLKSAQTPEDASLLLFYDSVKVTSSEGQPMLNLATPILDGFHAAYNYWPTIAGIGALGDPNFANPCYSWINDEKDRHKMVAATVSGNLKMDTIIMNGTKPVSGYHTITKAENNIIFEIDGKPALDLVDALMGGSVAWEDFPFFLTLGVNNGEKFGDYKEENYASRLCLAIDKDHKALVMFETDLTDGTEVQLMRRNIDFSYIPGQVEKVLDRIGDRKPVLAFYIDCLGRASAYSGAEEEEALAVRNALGDIPFFGIYSGVEIANVGAKVQALDWTGVLCLFSEP